MPDIVNTRAEIWAKNANGDDVVVGWTGGLVEPQYISNDNWNIPFTFHSGWLEQDSFYPPLTLRNIAVTDTDTGDQVLSAGKPVTIDEVGMFTTSRARSASKGQNLSDQNLSQTNYPTNSMTKGVHPSLIGPQLSSTAAASVPIVLFIRGFCQGGAMQTSHFNQELLKKSFVDRDFRNGANATERALDIMDSLGFIPGRLRGIVAHSQGGMAAATLLANFSYIFADNASSRPPNVVSMGTPYLGSDLGRLGDIALADFLRKVGILDDCKPPSDLQDGSGNDAWQRSIGYRARSQIFSFATHHSTSSLTTKCGAGSFVISGTDDGVVARSEVNGFATGGYLEFSSHCHLDPMPKRWQWELTEFVNYVNNLFFADFEDYQPF